jgi:hypothetical protein
MRCCVASSTTSSSEQHNPRARSSGKHGQAQDDRYSDRLAMLATGDRP